MGMKRIVFNVREKPVNKGILFQSISVLGGPCKRHRNPLSESRAPYVHGNHQEIGK